MSTSVDALLDSLRTHGTIDSAGAFTVSLTTARTKLTRFQSSSTTRYLVSLVSFGVASGATEVNISSTRLGLRLDLPGARCRKSELTAGTATLLKGQARAPMADLLIGCQGALSHGALEVVLRVENHQGESFLCRMNSEGDTFEALTEGTGLGVSLEIIFEEKTWKHRLPAWLASLRGYAGMRPEFRLVDSLCEHSPVPIAIDGDLCTRPVYLEHSPLVLNLGGLKNFINALAPVEEFPEMGWRGVFSLKPGTIEVVADGVSMGKIEGTGMQGLLYGDHLNRDLAREGLVEDEGYENLLRELKSLRCQGWLKVIPWLDFVEGEQLETTRNLLLSLVFENYESLESASISEFFTWFSRQLESSQGGDEFRQVWEMDVHARATLEEPLQGLLEEFSPSEIPPRLELYLRLCELCVRRGSLLAVTTKRTIPTWRLLGALKTLEWAPDIAICWFLKAVSGFRLRKENETLMVGYLLLGVGALLGQLGRNREAETVWMLALDAVRKGKAALAEELVYAHLEYDVDHMVIEVAKALSMFVQDSKELAVLSASTDF